MKKQWVKQGGDTEVLEEGPEGAKKELGKVTWSEFLGVHHWRVIKDGTVHAGITVLPSEAKERVEELNEGM